MTRPQYCNFCLCAARCYYILRFRIFARTCRQSSPCVCTIIINAILLGMRAGIDGGDTLTLTLRSRFRPSLDLEDRSQTCFGRRVRARTVVVHRSARVLLALYSTIHAQRPRSSYVCTANLAIGDTSPRLLYSPGSSSGSFLELPVHMPGLERPADLHFECDGLKS